MRLTRHPSLLGGLGTGKRLPRVRGHRSWTSDLSGVSGKFSETKCTCFDRLSDETELLVHIIKSSYTEQVLALLSGNPDNVSIVVRESSSLGLQSLLNMVPALTDVLTEECFDREMCRGKSVFSYCISMMHSLL